MTDPIPISKTAPSPSHFDRALGPVEATSIVVGTVIGSGIFVTPAVIAASAGKLGVGTILLVWAVCGLLSLAGALAYAELSAMFPRSGGQYVYL
ncbi:MAG TPA: amino acid permease, partial [Armatimonadota bacterium]|nr:amino acid permease [Armatimonadota bacterium]